MVTSEESLGHLDEMGAQIPTYIRFPQIQASF